jgi:hypothetical protein
MPDWLATTVSVLAGGALTIVSSWMSDGRSTKQERERRQEDRRDRLADRRNEFQRETLLSLQGVAQKLMRNAAACFHQDRMSYKKSGTWQRHLLPDDLSDNQLLLMTETMLLASRIRDEGTRNSADQLRSLVAEIGESENERGAASKMKAMGELQVVLIQRIGKLVREIDEGY